MKRIFTLLFLSSLTFFLNAQDAKIEGKIVDDKGEALMQANVIIDAAKGLATVTDFDGNYELSVPAGTYEVIYKYVGKEEQRIKMTLKEGEKRAQNLTLKEKERMIDQVVVSGSKYEKKLSEETVSMEVMKAGTLANQNVTDVQNGIQKIPGVTIADGQANIRGGSGWSYGAGSRVAVLYDGLPITTADADDAKWSMMPVENIEQIEVIKGASSAIYGAGALNGVINAITTYPTDKPFTKLQTYAGFYQGPSKTPQMKWWQGVPQSFGGVQFADRRKLGQWDVTTGLAYNSDKGYIDSSASQDTRVNTKIRYRFKKIEGLSVGVNVLAYWSWGNTVFIWDSIGNKGYKALSGTTTKYENARYVVDPFINYYDKKNNKFSFRYRLLNSSNVNSTGQGSIAQRHIIDISYQRPFDISSNVKLNFLGGVGARIDKIAPPKNPNDITPDSIRKHITDSLGYYPVPYLYGDKPHNAYNTSLYAQLDGKFFNRLNATIGARWEYFNVDGKNSLKDLTYPLMRVGLNYQAAKASYLRGSFGQGFRYPSIAEFFVTTKLGAISIFPNTKLKPEKGYSAEIGYKQGFKFGKKVVTAGYLDVAGFWNQYHNMMEFMFGNFKGDAFSPGFASQNIGNARILGTEIAVGTQTTYKDLTVNLLVGYTYINAVSLNWNDKLTLYDVKGDTLKPYSDPLFHTNGTTNIKNAPKGFDTTNYFTYGMTSSSTTNALKYRPSHQLKVVLNITVKRFDVNLDYQFIAFQKSIDYAFVSPFFTNFVPMLYGINSFKALEEYRAKQIANHYAGDHILNIGLGYKPVDKLKLAFIVKNVLNWEYMSRPGMFQAPRNFTLQASYTF